MEIAGEEVGGKLPIIHGVWADGSLEAARIARQAEAGGASALLVFPPAPFTLGQSAGMVLAHFKTISDATDLPLIVFQYPLATGQGYPAATLERLFDEVPTIRAIKDWTPLVPQHEAQIRALQGRQRPISVLSTNSAFLLSSLVLGCSGLLSGSGSVIADLQARLFRAVQANDLAEARRVHEATSVECALTVIADSPCTAATSRKCARKLGSSIERSSWNGSSTAGITP
jgi:4-hydroxy-tetrahydrodipicolinate synthase